MSHGGFGVTYRPHSIVKPQTNPRRQIRIPILIPAEIEALKEAGETEVVLAINHQQPEVHIVMLNFMKEYEKKLEIKIKFFQETEPLGTAGPLALARDKLVDESGEPFLVLNSDVICEYPLLEMIEFHKTHGAEASIMVIKVDDPSKYGVVVMEEATARVESFVEKPLNFVGNKINVGIYLLNPSVLDRIELRRPSIEKEIFPNIASEKMLYAMVLPGDYIIGNVLVDESVVIGEGCLIGPEGLIGPGCVIGSGERLMGCTVIRGVRIMDHACISNSIVGWASMVGRWARVVNITVLGKDVHVADAEVYNSGAVIEEQMSVKPEVVI
ncbi:unnamed protein product [Thlaspi arvense]|uniref:mannose-1-phosphate guanylyltransferase n=1 Tax=Thlaspi arvense TaxID=13288 RepID=A0AAU9SCX0_THLAR|nr:unnamed protein product [Thlaspi arvense]